MAVFIHFTGSVFSRRFKYELLISGLIILNCVDLTDLAYQFSIVPFGLAQVLAFTLSEQKISWNPIQATGLKVLISVLIAISLYGVIRLVKRWVNRRPEQNSRKMMSALNTGFIFCVFAPFVPVISTLLLFYALTRYFTVEKLAESPILYFRSFESSEEYFSEVISRVATRYGVVKGLVLDTGAELELSEKVQVQNRPQLKQTSHEEWQGWVQQALENASLAIIDTSTRSESVKWEIATATQHLGANKVILVHSEELLASAKNIASGKGHMALGEDLDQQIRLALL